MWGVLVPAELFFGEETAGDANVKSIFLHQGHPFACAAQVVPERGEGLALTQHCGINQSEYAANVLRYASSLSAMPSVAGSCSNRANEQLPHGEIAP